MRIPFFLYYTAVASLAFTVLTVPVAMAAAKVKTPGRTKPVRPPATAAPASPRDATVSASGPVAHPYGLELTGSYPVASGVGLVVRLNEDFTFRVMLGPPLRLSLDHQVSAATITQETVLEGSGSISIFYPSITIPLKIDYSRMMGFEFAYNLLPGFALTAGTLYRRVELSGVGDVPLYAGVSAPGSGQKNIYLQSNAHTAFRSTLDQVDLRAGVNWQLFTIGSFNLQVFGGLWYPMLRVVEPTSSVTIDSQIRHEIEESVVDVTQMLRPRLREIESGINDDLIEESLRNRIVLPLFAGLTIGYTF